MASLLRQAVKQETSLYPLYEANSEYGEKFALPEIVRRNNYHAHLFAYENDFSQYSRGLMPESVWDFKLVALTFL